MNGPCFKQTVTATIVAPDGARYVGTNDCRSPQDYCARDRAGAATGERYDLCQSVCHQTGHAEINALLQAAGRAAGGVLYLQGHTYACQPCIDACAAEGIGVVIGAPQ